MDLLSQNDPLYLKEVGGVGRIDLIVPETTGDGEVLSGNLRFAPSVLAETAVP